jgi:hypothetical protein
MSTPRIGRWLLALGACLACLLGCGNDDPVVPPGTPPPLLPLAVGNRWLYVDSMITSAGTATHADTVVVLGLRSAGATTWYELRSSFNPSIAASEFATSNDSIFSLQYTEAPGGMAPVISLEYLPPPAAGSLVYTSVFDGDALFQKSVAALHETVTVPAGSFADCAVYEYQIYPEHYREIVKPGLGVLSWELRADASVYGPAWRRTRTLTGYRVAGE